MGSNLILENFVLGALFYFSEVICLVISNILVNFHFTPYQKHNEYLDIFILKIEICFGNVFSSKFAEFD